MELHTKTKFHGIPTPGAKVPWNSMEHFMEFHGTLCHFKRSPSSSLEFHGSPREPEVNENGVLKVPWNSMECWCSWKWRPPISTEFHGTRWYLIWRLKSSMKWKIYRKGPYEVPLYKFRFLWNSENVTVFFAIILCAFPAWPFCLFVCILNIEQKLHV